MNPLAAGAVTVALLAGNAFFVAAEFALVSARRSSIEPIAARGSWRGRSTLRAMRRLSLLLAGAQLGVTICSVGLGAVSEPVLAHVLKPVFDAVHLPERATHPVAFVLALAIITGLHVVLGEMVPKNATLAGPDRAALWLAPPLAAVVAAFRPLIAGLNGATNLTLRLLRVEPRNEVSATVTAGQLPGVLRQSRREGLLEPDDHELLTNAIGFESATAADLTLPLDRVYTVGPDAGADRVERLAAATGVSRFPVRDGDRLLGYVHVRDILDTPAGQRSAPIPPSFRRRLLEVSADLPLPEAVERLRAAKTHVAAVTAPGRPGELVGVITLDDILAGLTR
jgi:CBS domain containing-hemolysin-like protein